MHMKMIMLLFFFVAGSVQAASWGSHCNYSTPVKTATMPSNIKISIDPNAPLGTVFFEYYISSVMSGVVFCDTKANYTWKRGLQFKSGGTKRMISGYGLSNAAGSYPVYETNVPGLGLVVRHSNTALPLYFLPEINETNKFLNVSWFSEFDVNLIKYGDIPAGAQQVTINSSILPDIEFILNISNSSNANVLPNGTIPLQIYTFPPVTIDILTATCDTPDSLVNLGSRKVSDAINREGGKFATPWSDASIQLANCPVFYGTGQRENYKGTTRNNIMTVTLIPNNATTSNQGIMPVDNVAGAAAGVGIQMAWGTSASPQFVNFASGKGTNTYTMSSTQGPTYTIPLVARYMQTAASISGVSPGKANGKVTYLINYY